MSPFLSARWLTSMTFIVVLGASAQTTSPAPQPQNSRPQADRSALADYQSFNDEKLAPWRESNDTVGSVGGWRAYAWEAQGQEARVPAASAASGPRAGAGAAK